MRVLQIVALVLCLSVTAVAVALFARMISHFIATFTVGQVDHGRTNEPATRTMTLVREIVGHTRMARKPVVAVAHWFVMVSFGLLFFTLLTAYGQLVDPHFALPLIGHFFLYEWATEFIAWTSLVGITVLMVIRQVKHPRSLGRRSRFFASTFWQAYYVELTILGVVICVLTLRGLEYALGAANQEWWATGLHFPLTSFIGRPLSGMSIGALETATVIFASLKILISMAWMITIAVQPTMGVAWHRFLAFFNVWFKRNADGKTALGPLKPMLIKGEPVDFENMEELDEDAPLGVGKVEDFTWKGLLDFTTCTECGRCQEQCPAWSTDKPLSPKMLVMAMRNHAHAKAPFLLAAEGERSGLLAADDTLATISTVPLVGETGYDISNPRSAYRPQGPDAVIDQDVLWSCTTCGACVEQCPVDIEHVDAIVDMRRHQVLIESAFPSELSGLFKNLENKANPWGMPARGRLDWAKSLPFEVKVLGQEVADASEVEYLFWVGCAGAYEDRAKKTTRAVAELLNAAGVTFAVLGDGETCTGDPARRAGNEFLFQMLAQANVETLNEVKATKIVVTCAHCFNTLNNEYPQIGGQYEVVHHTQLLNRLVRDKRLIPVSRPDEADTPNVASVVETVTYHDPCYLGRHNGVYAPPRELIGALPGVELREMPRSGQKSFCCGGGGARMWMEEKLGTRINHNRTEEALATSARRIAVACPFCHVMLSDGLTQKQSETGAHEEVEVVDVAQMLLAAVRRGHEQT